MNQRATLNGRGSPPPIYFPAHHVADEQEVAAPAAALHRLGTDLYRRRPPHAAGHDGVVGGIVLPRLVLGAPRHDRRSGGGPAVPVLDVEARPSERAGVDSDIEGLPPGQLHPVGLVGGPVPELGEPSGREGPALPNGPEGAPWSPSRIRAWRSFQEKPRKTITTKKKRAEIKLVSGRGETTRTES